MSGRQMVAWTTDNQEISISKSTVYRFLRRKGVYSEQQLFQRVA